MEQTKLGSFIESIINTLIGFGISFVAWPVAAGLFKLTYTGAQHIGVVVFFTVISVIRGYVIRRWFNQRLSVAVQQLAQRLS